MDISALHPGPVEIFKLWQVYLDNVNPLLKVTHTPSIQGRIIEAASRITAINPVLEALMFSIYSTSILSLETEECSQHVCFVKRRAVDEVPIRLPASSIELQLPPDWRP